MVVGVAARADTPCMSLVHCNSQLLNEHAKGWPDEKVPERTCRVTRAYSVRNGIGKDTDLDPHSEYRCRLINVEVLGVIQA